MRRVVFSAHQPYAVRAAELVREAAGWTPVYWLCRPEQMDGLRTTFGDNVVLHAYLDAVRGRPAPAFAEHGFPPFDPASLAPGEEMTALAMLDRNDSYSDSMGLRDRVRFVADGLAYWSGVFAQTGADTVVFEEVPHQAFDWLLYLAARHRGLTTIVPMRGLPDAGFLANDAVGRPPPTLTGAAPPQAPGVRAKTGAVDFLARMTLSYDAHLDTLFWDHKDSVREITRAPSRTRRVLDLIRSGRPKHALGRYWRNFRTFRNDQKVRGRSLAESEMGYAAFLLHKNRTLARKSRLRALYADLATPAPDLNRPFVYCCLQYQPEASTSPMAGRYVHQWLMVDQLVAALPEGWRLYVKEHPSQFSGEYARYGETFRSEEFYRRLTASGRVDLMPLTLDSFTLIDHARAVAGPGGTVCFEAVARGKPVLNFGGGFFAGCPGMAPIGGAADVAAAMARVADGLAPDAPAVRAFAEAIDRHTYPGAIGGPNQLDRMGVDVERNAELHRDCWLETAGWSERAADPAAGSGSAA